MNPLEKQLNYAFGDTLPEQGGKIEVVPGIYWVRLPLPFVLDHINVWLLRDTLAGRDGWTLVDTGAGLRASHEIWERIFANELDGLPIVRVICTHYHPDHFGNADWISSRFGCKVWMSQADYLTGRLMFLGQLGTDTGFYESYFRANGINDEATLIELRMRRANFLNTVPSVPPCYHAIAGGQHLTIGKQRWRLIDGYGHAPEHMALYAEDACILISGDMLLPRISTNVSVTATEPEGNPLQQFLDSIAKFLPLPADTLVLPAHGKPFTSIAVRVRQLQDHHRDRLAEVREMCRAQPTSARDVVPVMFKRKLDGNQLFIAVGEALAHLHLLWHAGELVCETDGDGVRRFRPV